MTAVAIILALTLALVVVAVVWGEILPLWKIRPEKKRKGKR